jgi:ketosteroid isomerase-like protein
MALLAGSCFLLLGCAATPQPPSAINASLENGVRAFEAEVLGSYNGDDPAQAASYYAANAVAFIPNKPPIIGREAITADIARYAKDPNFRLDYVNKAITVSASSDLAYTRGEWTMIRTDPKTNSAHTINGNYLLIMRRQPSSEWQVVEDISF